MKESPLRVRVFGGLEVWHRGRRWREFETRKAAALFGYLIASTGRQVTRASLAALLWPEANEAQGRQSVRQALYSITATLPRTAVKAPVLSIEGERVGINPEAGVWSDVSQFLALLGNEDSLDARHSSHMLARAVQLYRGELLSGVEVRDAPEFELWLVAEQERFRYLAIDALQALAATYLSRGEHRLGVEYARRLVAMDPFREEGHRLLMALLAAAGNRASAVAHYRTLVVTLESELGAEPAPQTTELFHCILGATEPAQVRRTEIVPRPYVPLVGRDRELAQLRRSWQRVSAGEGCVTIVEGESGIGKTRLLRSLLDELTHQNTVRIVTVSTEPLRIQSPFAPLDQVLARLCHEAVASGRDPVRTLDPTLQPALAALTPGIDLDVETPPREPGELSLELLAEGCTAVIRAARHSSENTGGAMILFLDDLQHAPASGLALLREVARRLANEPVWLLGSCDRTSITRHRRLAEACEAMAGVTHMEVLALGRLGTGQLATLASELLGEVHREAVADRLERVTGGLPLGIAMQVNLWWDEGNLAPASSTGASWELRSGDGLGTRCEPLALAQQRVAHLSPFLRRVLTLAAILGAQFDGRLLAEVEGEAPELVVAALDGLLERWFLLVASRDWTPGRWQHTATLEERGLGATRLEFDHEVLRRAVLARVSRQRRRALHLQVAHHMERVVPAIEDERLAHHYVEAGAYRQALVVVRGAIARRRESGVSQSFLSDLYRAEHLLSRACRRFLWE